MYIELTDLEGNKEYFFVRHIKRIFVTNNLETAIVGCNNNGYLEVRESIEQVLAKIKKLKS
tara:strand:- start:11714 stop:11896 length:183 start_codon:yes stop_codon:yes gene_type:complete